ncbi:zinc ribbon domain-containing protein, partial [Thiolapillus sp.]|uniref:zinc ribbon domain-containing protein n=1 Tax=Thiolapillus sp. TaxID=2017437 RepID=UPI003AF4F1BC
MDAGWHLLKTQLKYKAIARSGVFEEVNEAYSTQVCSCCRAKPDSSPKGRTALGIRHWICSECGAEHDRDINAALNILAAGGIPVSMEESSPFRASEDVKSTQRERNRQTMTNLILNKEL